MSKLLLAPPDTIGFHVNGFIAFQGKLSTKIGQFHEAPSYDFNHLIVVLFVEYQML